LSFRTSTYHKSIIAKGGETPCCLRGHAVQCDVTILEWPRYSQLFPFPTQILITCDASFEKRIAIFKRACVLTSNEQASPTWRSKQLTLFCSRSSNRLSQFFSSRGQRVRLQYVRFSYSATSLFSVPISSLSILSYSARYDTYRKAEDFFHLWAMK
jgi:hypothetical protein